MSLRGNSAPITPGQHMLKGALWVFLAEALFPLTGVITAGFLTRRLGAADYGLLTLTATLITWVEFCIAALFARGTIKVISDAADWRPVGAGIVRANLAVSVTVMLALWAVAGPVAGWLRAPALANYLRLFAVDVPLFALANSHRQILVGLGAYRQRAVAGAGRWIARLVLIIVLVECGLSVTGAILASLGASVVELVIARCYVRPAWWSDRGGSISALWDHAVPLFLAALSLRLFRLDLFAVQVLGGTAADVGFYGAAQNLAFLPALLGMAVAPLLLSTLTRVLREGDDRHARDVARDVMRLVILALPFWGLVAGTSEGVVRLVFGAKFAPAAPVVSPLMLASLALTLISITTAILTAAGRPKLQLALVGPMVPVAIAGHLWLVPRLGMSGAAIVTAGCALLGALGTVVAVFKVWQIAPPGASGLRSALLCAVAYTLAVWWPADGWLLLVKLAVISLGVVGGYLALGEFDAREIALARSLIPWRKTDD